MNLLEILIAFTPVIGMLAGMMLAMCIMSLIDRGFQIGDLPQPSQKQRYIPFVTAFDKASPRIARNLLLIMFVYWMMGSSDGIPDFFNSSNPAIKSVMFVLAVGSAAFAAFGTDFITLAGERLANFIVRIVRSKLPRKQVTSS